MTRIGTRKELSSSRSTAEVLSVAIASLLLASAAAGCAMDATFELTPGGEAYDLSEGCAEALRELAENSTVTGEAAGVADLGLLDGASQACREEPLDIGMPGSEPSALANWLATRETKDPAEPNAAQPNEPEPAEGASLTSRDPYPHPDRPQTLDELADPSPHPDKEGTLGEAEQE